MFFFLKGSEFVFKWSDRVDIVWLFSKDILKCYCFLIMIGVLEYMNIIKI